MFEELLALPFDVKLDKFISVHMACPCVNCDHPLVRTLMASRFLEERSELQKFAEYAVWCSKLPKTLDYLKDHKTAIRRWWKEAGCSYREVDWRSTSPELQPPYAIRAEDGEILQITGDDFARWADATVEDPSK
jgi:hypothetical protein